MAATTIPALVREAGARYGELTAVFERRDDRELTLSFAVLAAQCERAARGFVSRGLLPGERVAVWAPNRYEWIVAAAGAQMAGAVLVPLNTRYKPAEASFILSKSGARVLVTVGGFLGTDYAAAAAALRPQLPELERVVRLDDASWDELLADGHGDVALPEVAPGDPSDMLFTSGTTGFPKGVVTHHGQNLRVFSAWSELVGLRTGDRYLIVNPFFHSFGYKAGWLACLMRGATIVPQAVFDAEQVLARIGRDRISMLPGPPALYQSILAHPRRGDHDLSSLRLAVTGAASIPVELIHRMRDELGFRTVITGYGLTEACGVATMCRFDDDPETIASTSGRALPDVQVRCVDAAGAEVAPGVPGEVVVRGYNVMAGYFEDAAQTAEAIDADGWLHTGDVGVMDERGYLRITDRVKDMFTVGGFNVYPAEIERALLARGDIAQAAVIGVPDDRLGEVPIAYVVPASGAELEPDELRAWCRDAMANYKVPRRIELVSSLPMNATGKVLKYALRERAAMFATRVETVRGVPMHVFANRPRSLRDLLERAPGGAAGGDRDYLVFGDRRMSVGEHRAAVASLARTLRDDYGIGKGDRVAILGANAPEWIVAFWATVSVGAVAVALNGWWTRDEILYGLDHAQPSLLIADRERLARIADVSLSMPVLGMDDEVAALAARHPDAPLPDAAIDEDDDAIILYTSGTTGRPKGVVHTHRNVIALVSMLFYHGARLAPAAAGAQPCRLTTNPLFHVSGLHCGAIAHLAGGVRSVWIEGRFEADKVLAAIERERCDGWSPQGAMAHRVLRAAARERFDTSSVTSLGCGGAPVTPAIQSALRELFPAAAGGLGVGYGSTETTALVTINYGEQLARHPDSVGRPLPTVELELRGGEIYVRGPMVMKGYWRDPAATAAVLSPDGWLRTGDLGRLEGGRLYIDTRRDDLILRSAQNVYPAEVEARLEQHPAVAEVAVVGVAHDELGQEVSAVVVPRQGATLDLDELARFAGEALAGYKVPSRWVVRATPLPRNASGKVAKYALVS